MYLFLEFFELISALLSGLFSFRKKESVDLSSRDLLILPGFGAGKGFYSRLEKSLAEVGYRPTTLDVPPFASEREYVAHINSAFATVDKPIIVLAHNTAGIVVGALPDTSRRKIGTLVSLGTPYRGFKFLSLFSRKNWTPGSTELEIRLPAYLFINHFHPLSPIREYVFLPEGENLQYGQGRDQWFDIPGNYNLVRRRENIRTLKEFIPTFSPPIPIPPKDSYTIPAQESSTINKRAQNIQYPQDRQPSKSLIPKKSSPSKSIADKPTSKKSHNKNITPKKPIVKKPVPKKSSKKTAVKKRR